MRLAGRSVRCIRLAGLLAVLRLSGAWAADDSPVRLAISTPPSLPLYQKTTEVIRRVFQRLHTPYVLVYLPSERAFQSLIAGNVDANVGRVAIFQSAYPQALRVEPALYSYRFVAAGRAGLPTVHTWEELGRYKVACRRGVKQCEVRMAGNQARQLVNNTISCLMMAGRERVDYCAGPGEEIEFDLRTLSSMRWTVSPLPDEPAYIYLHPRFAGLADKLRAVLTAMKKSGELQQIYGGPQ